MTSNGSTELVKGIRFFAGHAWIQGDLHQLLNVLILDATGNTWKTKAEHPLSADDMLIRAPVWYEANSLLVFPLELAEFNLAANILLNKILLAEGSGDESLH